MDTAFESVVDVVTDELTDVITDMRVKLCFSDVVMAAVVIVLDFAVPKPCARDILAGMMVGVLVGALSGAVFCVRPGIGVDALAEVLVNVSAAVIIAMPSPLEKSLLFC